MGDDTMIDYGFTKELETGFETAVKQVTEQLQEVGFSVLTMIDVAEKFRQKLGIDFRKYVILGACNPTSAHKAIEAEENIGLMLPCNIIVYEKDDHVVVSAIKPTVAMQMINNTTLAKIATDVEERIKQVIDGIE
jgi:uncharacterized protein (DUF302 family)